MKTEPMKLHSYNCDQTDDDDREYADQGASVRFEASEYSAVINLDAHGPSIGVESRYDKNGTYWVALCWDDRGELVRTLRYTNGHWS